MISKLLALSCGSSFLNNYFSFIYTSCIPHNNLHSLFSLVFLQETMSGCTKTSHILGALAPENVAVPVRSVQNIQGAYQLNGKNYLEVVTVGWPPSWNVKGSWTIYWVYLSRIWTTFSFRPFNQLISTPKVTFPKTSVLSWKFVSDMKLCCAFLFLIRLLGNRLPRRHAQFICLQQYDKFSKYWTFHILKVICLLQICNPLGYMNLFYPFDQWEETCKSWDNLICPSWMWASSGPLVSAFWNFVVKDVATDSKINICISRSLYVSKKPSRTRMIKLQPFSVYINNLLFARFGTR